MPIARFLENDLEPFIDLVIRQQFSAYFILDIDKLTELLSIDGPHSQVIIWAQIVLYWVANVSLTKLNFFVKQKEIVLLLEMSFINTRVAFHG